MHCGIYVGEGRITHVDWSGKHQARTCDWQEDMLVLTPIAPLSVEERVKLLEYISNENVRGYSFWDAVKSWFWKNIDDEKPIGNRYTCSSFVSVMYRKIGKDLVPNRSDDTTQPHDFLESPLLRQLTRRA